MVLEMALEIMLCGSETLEFAVTDVEWSGRDMLDVAGVFEIRGFVTINDINNTQHMTGQTNRQQQGQQVSAV